MTESPYAVRNAAGWGILTLDAGTVGLLLVSKSPSRANFDTTGIYDENTFQPGFPIWIYLEPLRARNVAYCNSVRPPYLARWDFFTFPHLLTRAACGSNGFEEETVSNYSCF